MRHSINFIGIIPFFNFSIGLRMINARFDMFDFIIHKKVFKSAICIAVLISLIGIELCPTIGQHLLNACQAAKSFHNFLEEL